MPCPRGCACVPVPNVATRCRFSCAGLGPRTAPRPALTPARNHPRFRFSRLDLGCRGAAGVPPAALPNALPDSTGGRSHTRSRGRLPVCTIRRGQVRPRPRRQPRGPRIAKAGDVKGGYLHWYRVLPGRIQPKCHSYWSPSKCLRSIPCSLVVIAT